MIVDAFPLKELSRKAVLEQQECNKNEIEKLLEDQKKKFQGFLQDQVKKSISFFFLQYWFSLRPQIVSSHFLNCC